MKLTVTFDCLIYLLDFLTCFVRYKIYFFQLYYFFFSKISLCKITKFVYSHLDN
jgi:hypothetical protein